MKNIFLLIIATTIMTSCNFNKSQVDKQMIRYKMALESFDHKLTDHFPDNIDGIRNLHSIFPKGLYVHGFATIQLSLTESSEEIKKKLNSLKKNGALKYSITSDYVFIINDSIESNHCKNCMPIPDFEYLAKSLNIPLSEFNESFQVYVFEAKSGIFLDDEYLINHKNFPKSWLHGFSRGVLISEKYQIVTYWLDVW